MIEAVLFDFYDTLVRIRTDDWGDQAMRGVAYFLRYRGIILRRTEVREAAMEALQRQIDAASDPNFEVDLGLVWRTVIEERAPEYVARNDDASITRLGKTLARIQRSQSREEFTLRDDVVTVLEDLGRDFRLGILSNGQGDFVRPELAELGIDHHFAAVTVSSDHGCRKPDPRLFHHGATALGVPVDAAIHVGSLSDRDGQGAARATMASITLAPRASSTHLDGVAVRTVRALRDVPAVVRAITTEAPPISRLTRVTPIHVGLSTPAEVLHDPADLEELARRILAGLGTSPEAAAEVARHLVRSNLAGHDSHGVMRLPQYAQMVADGTVTPHALPRVVAERGATVLVDGGSGFGQVTAAFALETATARVEALGAVVVAMRNANHLGRIGDYAETAASRGHVAIVTVGAAGPGIGGAAPFGGREAFLSTNPWAIGVPSDAGTPVLVDFATTVIPEGKVRVARDTGKSVPTGTIMDGRGRVTTDPNAFYAGGVLLPLGGEVAGHKGYGLGMAAALLGGLAAIGQPVPNLVGALPPPQGSADTTGGAVLILIDPSAFGPLGEYRQAVGRVSRAARRTPPTGTAVQVPGDPEARSTAIRSRDGIPVPHSTWESIRELADQLHVELPK